MKNAKFQNTILSRMFFIGVFSFCVLTFGQSPAPNYLETIYPIIPTPQEISYGNSELIFTGFHIESGEFPVEADVLRKFLNGNDIQESADGITIQFIKEQMLVDHPEEAYELEIDQHIKISAETETGAFYALKTLEQIFRKHKHAGRFPKLKIKDWPAFKIRGFMHDTGRNFQSVAQLKEQIEVLSQYKYNVFHWHLTDDPAWRLESKRYPQLQSEEATSRGKGKYYSQEDFKDILAFCKARHITVIPEFDIPGHSRAFRNAMGFESMKDPRALPTLLNLFDELCTLASPEEMPFIHIGTDEVRNSEEYVEDGFVKHIMDRVKSHERELIVWMEGIDVKGDSTSINQLWAQFDPRPGHRFIDSRANYINHLDPFAGMSRLFFQQPCRQPKGDALALGGILCAWPDNAVEEERDILKQNPIYPSIVFYADAIWKGRQENKLDYWAKLPPLHSADLQRFKDFEAKVLVHRDLFFQDKEFPYIRQTNIAWNVIGPFENNNEVETKFPVEDVLKASYEINGQKYSWSEPKVGATIHLKHFFDFPALTTQKTGTFYATTQIYAPEGKIQDFWIGFQGWSRSGGRRVGPFPNQGQWHTTLPKIWVNAKEVDPPVWQQPGLGTKTDEIPFVDEDYFYRKPTKVKLRKGWNSVLLKIPQDTNSWKWMFTCVPVELVEGQPKEVEGIQFQTPFNSTQKVSLSDFPKDYQLFARDSTNSATFRVAGIALPSVDSVIVKVHGRDDIKRMAILPNKGHFEFAVPIAARKHNYTVELFYKEKTAEEIKVKTATHITAGDFYVLSGQSNAWAIDYDNAYSTKELSREAQWVRTLGAMHIYNHPAIIPEATNTDWYIASGKAPDMIADKALVGEGMVGVLAMNIALNLVKSEGVPIAIINGAGGGGAISYYQKTIADDLNSVYGRLLYRVEASGLQNKIKAFIWNQGENNAGDAVEVYENALNSLYSDLMRDYKFEKFYIIQTPPGCNSETGHQNVREAQRRFAASYDKVNILTRHGFPLSPNRINGSYFLSDGCHYHAFGYEQLAKWIAGLAQFDFYGAAVSYEAPQLVQVKLERSNLLKIEFDKPVTLQQHVTINEKAYSIKSNAFALNGKRTTKISNIKRHPQDPKIVILTFAGRTLSKGDTLTYILGDTYPKTSQPYIGPWITDARTGVGVVGFSAVIQ